MVYNRVLEDPDHMGFLAFRFLRVASSDSERRTHIGHYSPAAVASSSILYHGSCS